MNTPLTCGVPCPRHGHPCARSQGHRDRHRDVKQKGDHGCEWATPDATTVPALLVTVTRLRSERDEARTLAGVRGDLLDETRTKLERAQQAGRDTEAERDEARARLAGSTAKVADLAAKLERSRREHDADRDALAAATRERDEARAELDALRARIATVRAWTNEDGKEFIFAADLLDAIGGRQ